MHRAGCTNERFISTQRYPVPTARRHRIGPGVCGFAAKALILDLVYADLAYLVPADPGNATTDDGDDSGKAAPHDGSTASKIGNFAKAILATVSLGVPSSLAPVHGLPVSDLTGKITLPYHYLPNAETGPPVGGRHCAQPTSAAPRPFFFPPRQAFSVVRTERTNAR